MSFIHDIKEQLKAAKLAAIEQQVADEARPAAEAHLNAQEQEVNRLQDELSAKREQLAQARADFDEAFSSEAQEVG